MGRPNPERRNGITQDRSPVRESRTPGSARGAGRKASPYRDRLFAPNKKPPRLRIGIESMESGRGDSLVRASGGNSKGLEFDVEAELGELGDQPFGLGFR